MSEPWGLTCCGDGREGGLLANRTGVVDIGFKLPAELPDVFRSHGAFVMASHFEPWGVAIAEAAATGLPLICTTACGASVDLVRSYYNGLVTAPRDVDGLARAMQWVHEHESDLPAMGQRSHVLSEAFSAESWAARWHNYLLEALENPAGAMRDPAMSSPGFLFSPRLRRQFGEAQARRAALSKVSDDEWASRQLTALQLVWADACADVPYYADLVAEGIGADGDPILGGRAGRYRS